MFFKKDEDEDNSHSRTTFRTQLLDQSFVIHLGNNSICPFTRVFAENLRTNTQSHVSFSSSFLLRFRRTFGVLKYSIFSSPPPPVAVVDVSMLYVASGTF